MDDVEQSLPVLLEPHLQGGPKTHPVLFVPRVVIRKRVSSSPMRSVSGPQGLATRTLLSQRETWTRRCGGRPSKGPGSGTGRPGRIVIASWLTHALLGSLATDGDQGYGTTPTDQPGKSARTLSRVGAKTCLFCGEELGIRQRTDAKFCGTKCRVAAHRTRRASRIRPVRWPDGFILPINDLSPLVGPPGRTAVIVELSWTP
ncbi:MAG: hypothetical protein K0S98_1119 [Propionibacteriaceae bacterium]|nr:hypothetical protein [Propionibacteriaceae bacterium]